MLSKTVKAWNHVIFETFYSTASAGLPVYLDLDEEKAEAIASHPSLAGQNSIQNLISAVEDSLRFDLTKSDVFIDYEQETYIWINDVLAKRPVGAPPMLALLAVSVLAAEKMGSDGGKGNAYYIHLNSMLNVVAKRDVEAVEESYRKVILNLWQALETFLHEKNGSQGLPTAFSLSNRHVGYAVSQALVRDFDRKKFPRMFDYLRLTPGSSISASDMQGVFQAWLGHEDNGVSQSLKKLWDGGAQAEISQVLCVELAKWDGTLPENQRVNSAGVPLAFLASKAKLVARFTSRLGTEHLSLTFAINTPTKDLQNEKFFIEGAGEKEFKFTAHSNNLAECFEATDIVPDSLLRNILTVKTESQKSWRRSPRNIVLFALDEDSRLWLEVEKASLGQRLILLVRTDAESFKNLPAFLQKNARPGFAPEFRIKNLPTGWGIFRDVEIITVDLSSNIHDDLRCLIPVSGSQIVIADGLRLPTTGSLRFWHREMPPRIQGISQSSKNLLLEIKQVDWSQSGKLTTNLSESNDSGFIELELKGRNLSDGNYKVVLSEGNEILSERDMFLRSSQNPDAVAVLNRPSAGHSMDHGAYKYLMNGGSSSTGENQFTSGFSSNFSEGVENSVDGDFGHLIDWEEQLDSEGLSPSIDLGVLDASSCAFTGSHHKNLGTWDRKTKYVIGVCQKCGQRSVELCLPWLANKKEPNSKKVLKDVAAAQLKAPKILAVANEKVEWDLAIDIAHYSVFGTFSSLVTCLDRLATAKYSAWQIAQELEILGFIEVTRDEFGTEQTWALPHSQVVLRGDQIDLLGYWPTSIIQKAVRWGYAQQPKNNRISFCTLGEHSIDALYDFAEEIDGFGFGSADPLQLVASLPYLSEVMASATRQVLPAINALEQFDFESGKWIPSESGFPSPGAFKVKGNFGNRYFAATEEDLGHGKAVPGSATFVKWLGANILEAECIAYRSKNSKLYTPLGMNLFGLYARAASAVSGKTGALVKSPTSGKTYVSYEEVPLEIAGLIAINSIS